MMMLISEHDISKYYDFEKNVGVDFSKLTVGSNKTVWWKCELGHPWEARVANMAKTERDKKCPFCANKKLLKGFNDFATKHPELLSEWDYEKNAVLGITPDSVKFNERKEVWWKCPHDHSWQNEVVYRSRGYGDCVRCESLGENFPELLEEWDYKKNEIDPYNVRHGSVKIAWWIGKHCGHSWDIDIRARTRDKHNCPFCCGQRILQGFNDLATKRPDLAKLWSKKNDKMATEVGTSGKKKSFWEFDCGHEKESSIDVMTKNVNTKCSICSSILYTHPEIAKQFYTEKNEGIDILSLSAGSDKKVWWRDDSCGHEWEQKVYSRIINSDDCQVCINKQVVIGFNDFPSQNPELFAEWNFDKNELDPYSLTIGSGRKAWWKCIAKGHEWDAVISDRSRGSRCPDCSSSSSTSQPEKEIVEYLVNNGITSVQNSRTLLKGRLELDIYIPEKNIAIEFNGIYWHSEACNTSKDYHFNKWELCKERGIQLITIWEDDWRDKKEVIQSMLAHKLGFSNSKRVYARKTVAKDISKEQADVFLVKNHIQGSVDGGIRIGLFEKENVDPVAVMVFKKKPNKAVELVRYATSQNVVGGFTKLIKYFEKEYSGYTKIETFADHCVSDGGLYENNGFVEDYKIKPDYSYVINNRREHKFNYRLKRFKNDPGLAYEDGLTERKLAELNGLNRIWDCGKTKYVKILNNMTILQEERGSRSND